MDTLFFIYGRKSGTLCDGSSTYELFFSKNRDTAWGEGWNEECPSACGEIPPDESSIDYVAEFTSDVEFTFAHEQSCFSMQDCIDGCIAMMWSIEHDGIFFIRFGEEYTSVRKMLSDEFGIELEEQEWKD